MLKKDYIQRQFEEFGKVMAIILGHKHQRDWERFGLEIAKAVNTFTSLEIKDLVEMTDKSFEILINDSAQLKSEQIKILADLLYERSFISMDKENVDEMKGILKKANFLYKLYSDTLTTNDYNVEVRYRIELIRKIVDRDS